MAIGESITLLEGTFAGHKGKVVREAAEKVDVRVSVFGQVLEVSLSRAELGWPSAGLDVLEGEVLDAVVRRGFHDRRTCFWMAQSQRRPVLPLPQLCAAWETFSDAVTRQLEEAQAEARTRFREAFEPLTTEQRDQKWAAERESWLAFEDEAKSVTDALQRPLLGSLEGAGRDAEVLRLNEAGMQLWQQVSAWQRKHGLTAEPVAEPRNEAMELEIERNIERDEPFLVYGDWLLLHSNPRGELIALQAAGSAREGQEARLRTKLDRQLLGPLAPFESKLQAKWRLGFLSQLQIEASRAIEAEGIDVVQLLEAAWRLPSVRFLRILGIGCPSMHEVALVPRIGEVLASGGVRPTLRKLAFVTNTDEEMLSWTSAGELSGYSALFPNLEILEVHAGKCQLTAPDFPRMRRLRLKTCGLTAQQLTALSQARWPALERLEVWAGSASHGVELTVEQYRPLLQSTRLPRLKALGLCNCEVTDALCAAVLESPLLPQLEELSLSMGTMSEAGARVLLRGADRLRHLKSLDVDDNYLGPEVLEELQRALPQTQSNAQRTAEEHEGQLLRFASVGQ
jgi:hypothetical protein